MRLVHCAIQTEFEWTGLLHDVIQTQISLHIFFQFRLVVVAVCVKCWKDRLIFEHVCAFKPPWNRIWIIYQNCVKLPLLNERGYRAILSYYKDNWSWILTSCSSILTILVISNLCFLDLDWCGAAWKGRTPANDSWILCLASSIRLRSFTPMDWILEYISMN